MRLRCFDLLRQLLPALVLTLGAAGCAPPGEDAPPATNEATDLTQEIATGGQPLWNAYSFYPRVIRLQNSGTANGRLVAAVVTNLSGAWVGAIFHSDNNGQSFTRIGAVNDPAASEGMCCHTLYELPTAVGSMPAGTLLWAASFGADAPASTRRMRERVWKSQDGGRTWTFLSTIHTASNTLGTWEPEFIVANDGSLVVFFSDETDPNHSQKLVKARSLDGVTWTDLTPVVKLVAKAARPGMAVVRRMPSGNWLMSYEVCSADTSHVCEAYVRKSVDGWNWGDPATIGTRVRTASGRYPASTPTITVAGNTVLMDAMRIRNADGTFAPNEGGLLLANASDGDGNWFEVAAPISINDSGRPDANGVPCPGYSNPLLGSKDGKAVLQIATTWNASGWCQAYVGSAASAPIGGANATESVAAYATPGQEHYFFRNSASELRHIYWDTTRGWVRDSWGTGIAGAPSAFVYGTQQHVFARTSTGELKQRFWDAKDGVTREGIWATGIASDPVTMVNGDAQHAWAVDTAGALRHWWWAPGFPVRSDTWASSGTVGKPNVMLQGGQEHVFVRTTTGEIEHRWWNPYQGMRTERFGANVAGPPVSAQMGDAHHTWAVDTGGALRHWWWNPNQGWQQDVWGTGVTGRPAVMLVGSEQHLFIRSTTNELRHIWWAPSTGMGNEVWGTGIVTDPTALLIDTVQHVWAQDGTGTTRHWWKNPGGGLLQNDWGR